MFLAACADQPPADYGDPTSANATTVEGGIAAYVVTPDTTARHGSSLVMVQVAAWVPDDPGRPLSAVFRTLDGAEQPAEIRGGAGEGRRLVAELRLLHGANPIVAVISDDSGEYRRALDFTLFYEGLLPAARVALVGPVYGPEPTACTAPLAEGVVGTELLCIEGRATAKSGALSVSIRSAGSTTPATLNDGRFVASVPLARDAVNELRVVVSDEVGRSAEVPLWVIHDQTAPTLTIDLPAPDDRTTAPSIPLRGRVADDNGVYEVQVATSAGESMAVPTQEGGSFEVVVPLAEGQNLITVTAYDVAGNIAVVDRSVWRDRTITLRAPRVDAIARLDLDRFAIEALLEPEEQANIVLLRLDLRPALIQTMAAIRQPERYGVDTSGWGTSEWNLWRLLNMTPDTADLRGTGLEEMLAIGDAIGLPSPRILAEVHGLGTTDVFLRDEAAADAALTYLIGTHPNISRDDAGNPVVSITLADAFDDMRALAVRFGPSGGHPGFLAGETFARTLEPAFRMELSAESTLREHDAVDLTLGRKDFVYLGDGVAALDLDFDDPDAFTIVGLVDEPEMTLRFEIEESPRFYRAGGDQLARPDGTGFYRGSGNVWDAPPWVIERFVAEAGFAEYRTAWSDTGYERTFSYDAGSIEDVATIDWDRGWVTITTAGGLGNPPEPTYVWDTLVEIAQVRLHDGGLAEGDAGVSFELTVPVGFTADELLDALRPTLEEQADEIAATLVGGGVRVEQVAEFFLELGTDGRPLLFFRAPEDAPDEPYPFDRPGFFADPELEELRSSTAPLSISDDDAHHKLVPAPGDVVFAADELGAVFRIEIDDVGRESVSLRVTPI